MAYAVWTMTGRHWALDGTPTMGVKQVEVRATVPEIRDASGAVVLESPLPPILVDPGTQEWTVDLPGVDPGLSPQGFEFLVSVVSPAGTRTKRVPPQPGGTVLDWSQVPDSAPAPVPAPDVAVTTATIGSYLDGGTL